MALPTCRRQIFLTSPGSAADCCGCVALWRPRDNCKGIGWLERFTALLVFRCLPRAPVLNGRATTPEAAHRRASSQGGQTRHPESHRIHLEVRIQATLIWSSARSPPWSTPDHSVYSTIRLDAFPDLELRYRRPFSDLENHLQRTRSQRSRQHRRQKTSVTSPTWAMIPTSGGIGTARADPFTTTRTKPPTSLVLFATCSSHHFLVYPFLVQAAPAGTTEATLGR